MPVYVNLTDCAIENSAEVADGIVVDYDDEGRIVALKFSTHGNEPKALPR
jgi:uncharacterized protein YuzE